jgi:hypothetical protein
MGTHRMPCTPLNIVTFQNKGLNPNTFECICEVN